MSSEYDSITAKHYAAYRPALHEMILKKCLVPDRDFQLGLDIGCGTGHSSIALSKFCHKVIGIDPSIGMIENAIEHSKIEYQIFNGANLDFESNTFELITFAGSLHYAKSQKLLDEVVRVTKIDGLVLVYDFEILLANVLNELGFKTNGNQSYDHEADFSGLNGNNISLLKTEEENVSLQIGPQDLGHLLLSVKEQYEFFQKELKKTSVYSELVQHLEESSSSDINNISANLYYKVYSISKLA